eukprot:CAMPEP_0116853716 /NCGR_PEP_ID=MMETSP0418-20121206/18103_1 /TAXON_ID=1158023 /ORGANISM="Astrosyne radiata, Strain 13vi08-1A" /LENGTH=560 /DNA_ID=CAMNT_0004486221 /DNA_START=273 /DNA_END=1955 /DNA_ORIENTATION=+
MLLPHVLFVGVAACFKVLFPRVISWLATETYATFLLSIFYPFCWNISLLYHYRHPPETKEPQQSPQKEKRLPFREQSNNVSPAPKSARKDKSTKKTNSPKGARYPSFLRTSPRAKRSNDSESKPDTIPKTIYIASDSGDSSVASRYDVVGDSLYWLEYWVVLAVVMGVCRVVAYTPIMGKILSRSKWVRGALVELELAFFVWIFGLSSVLTQTASNDSDRRRSYETRPLKILIRRIQPIVVKIYNGTSEIITEATWKKISDKVSSFLQLAVMVRLLSEKRKDQILHIIEHSHAVLVPAVTLLMPGFAKYGVLYIQSIVPSFQSCRVLDSPSLSDRMGRLEYWVLHVFVNGVLEWWGGLLWWIPFSMHAIFVLWWHLQTPRVSKHWFDVLEDELQAFGLLGSGKVRVEDTVTATVLQAVVQSLPSGATEEEDEDQGRDETVGSGQVTDDARGKGQENIIPRNDSTGSDQVPISTALRDVDTPSPQKARSRTQETASNPNDSNSPKATQERQSRGTPAAKNIDKENTREDESASNGSSMEDTASKNSKPRRSERIRKLKAQG